MQLEEIHKEYSEAIIKSDFGAVSEIVSRLNNEGAKFKKEAISLYKQIGDDLFLISRNLSNYDLRTYALSIEEWEKKTSGILNENTDADSKKNPVREELKFEQIFVEFYNRHFEIFSQLKDFYLFRLQKGDYLQMP